MAEVGDHGPWRLFTALPVPPESAGELWALLAPYRGRFPAARWIPATSLHMTLVFLGGVPAGRVGRLDGSLEAVAGAHARFEVATGPGSGRARGGDGVAWLGLPRGGAEVARMGAELEALLPADLVVSRRGPRRSLSAHLTVARRADQALIDALAAQRLGPLEAVWTVDRLALLRSHLGRGGSVYELIREFRLGPAQSRAGTV